MFEVGMKVYGWSGDYFALCSESKDPIIGTIIEVLHDTCRVESVITEDVYHVAKWKLYECGQGPIMDKESFTYSTVDLFEDTENEEEVIFNIPPEITAQLGLVVGDELEWKVSDNSVSFRKKEKV